MVLHRLILAVAVFAAYGFSKGCLDAEAYPELGATDDTEDAGTPDPSTCGDGVQDAGESCDDGAGNIDPDAWQFKVGCTWTCEWSKYYCGNGIEESEESCDDANEDETDGCTVNCK